MGNKGNPGGMAPSGGLRLPTSNAPPNTGPMQPLAQSNIPQGIPPQMANAAALAPILQLLGQKGGAGMRPPGAMGPIGTQGGSMPMTPTAPPPFSMQALTAQGRPYGFNPADPSRLEGAVRPAMSEVLGQNQGILDHMQRYRAMQGGSGQPFDQGGLTPPATPPAATPPATPPPTQQQGWPTNLLGLLQAMGINTTG